MVDIKTTVTLNAQIPVCWNTTMLICIKWSQKVYLGHKTAAVFSDISRLNCNKTLSLTSTTDVLLNGEDEQEETRILWFICMKTALGWSSTGESRKPEASCLNQRFVLLAAARITSTHFSLTATKAWSLPERPWGCVGKASGAQTFHLSNCCITVEAALLSI